MPDVGCCVLARPTKQMGKQGMADNAEDLGRRATAVGGDGALDQLQRSSITLQSRSERSAGIYAVVQRRYSLFRVHLRFGGEARFPQ